MRSLSIPFQYVISYKKSGRSQETKVWGRSDVDVEFRDVPASETRLVAEVSNGLRSMGSVYLDSRFVWEEVRARSRLLRFEDGLWLEWGGIDELMRRLRDYDDAKGTPFAGRYWRSVEEYSTLEAEMLANRGCKEAQSDEAELAQAFRDAAARTIVVDGIAYERVREPRLAIRLIGDGPARIGIMDFVDETTITQEVVLKGGVFDTSSNARLRELPLDCLGDRIDRIGDLAARLRANGIDAEIACTVIVHEPGAFQRDVIGELGGKGITAILRAALDMTGAMDEEMADPLLELRDAVLAAGPVPTEQAISALGRLAQLDTARLVPGTRRPELIEKLEAVQVQVVDRARDVLRSWGRSVPDPLPFAESTQEEDRQEVGAAAFVLPRRRSAKGVEPIGVRNFVLPLDYEAEYKLKGKKLNSRTVLTTTMQAAIPVMATPESPAYVLGHSGGSYFDETSRNWRRFPLDGDRPARVWRFGDELYSEYCPAEDLVDRLGARGRQAGCDTPLNVRSHDGLGGRAGLTIDGGDRRTYDELLAQAPLKLWEDDGGRRRGEVVQQRLAAFRIVDGMVCVKVREPVLCVQHGAGRTTLKIIEAYDLPVDGFGDTGEIGNGVRIRMDGLDFARDLGRRVAEETGTRFSEDVRIDVMGDVYPYPHEGERLHASAVRMSNACRTMMAELPRPVARAALRLRDALRCCPEGAATQQLAAALEELRGVVGSLVDVERGVNVPNRADLRAMAPEVEGVRLLSRRRSFEREDMEVLDSLAMAAEACAAWALRGEAGRDWSDDALPIAADQGIEQILSEHDLRMTAERLDVDLDALEGARREGAVLLKGLKRGDAPVHDERFIAIASADLQLLGVFGPGGRDETGRRREFFASFLARNSVRLEDRSALSAISFVA